MRFFVDHQLPPALALWLEARGHEARTARQSGLRNIDDAAIWQHCTRIGMIVVSKDQDFADMALTQDGPQVVWVRIGNAVNDVLIARFKVVWPEVEELLTSGAHLIEVR